MEGALEERTPRPYRNVGLSETPIVTAKAYHEGSPRRTDTQEFSLVDGTPYTRRVQAQCFTPSKTLVRSPALARHSPTTLLQEVENDFVSAEPLKPKWEIPRTPVMGLRSNNQVCLSPVLSTIPATVVCPSNETSSETAVKSSMITEEKENSPPLLSSPKVSVQCTQNDLDFLDRLKNLKMCEELQSQLLQSEREVRRAQQEKEHLIEQREKISHDLDEMRREYQNTVLTVRSLLEQSTRQHPNLPPMGFDLSQSPTPVSSSEQRKLARMRQLVSVELDHVTAAVNNRRKQLQTQKEVLQLKIKQHEEELCQAQESLYKELKHFQEDRSNWESKVADLGRQHKSTEIMLAEKESELRQLQFVESADTAEQSEKERAKQRLEVLTRRVELYIDRQQRLKRMSHTNNK